MRTEVTAGSILILDRSPAETEQLRAAVDRAERPANESG